MVGASHSVLPASFLDFFLSKARSPLMMSESWKNSCEAGANQCLEPPCRRGLLVKEGSQITWNKKGASQTL